MMTAGHEVTICDGGVAWDQRNCLEYQAKAEFPETPQGVGGEIAKKGYLVSWGHINAALASCAQKHPENMYVRMSVTTIIKCAHKIRLVYVDVFFLYTPPKALQRVGCQNA